MLPFEHISSRDLLYPFEDLLHCRAGFIDIAATFLNDTSIQADQLLYLLGGIGGALGQLAKRVFSPPVVAAVLVDWVNSLALAV
ncbi:hypothetical protein [Billgrantia aerodenitrificans]|jgi:hypothetical protein|uniref:Uncharacterized protein n=1 Tax=Billgrantia aerodenitrificans TaxID=2733483 RepID=A0ABS9AM48_9GAMM|nr:hypothetical protein [Halomonas aerodenitrificans]MCE8022799.1 hypothetical protein [Halomonas aerodenitrificans]